MSSSTGRTSYTTSIDEAFLYLENLDLKVNGILLIICIATLMRILVGQNGYSGMGKPPMFGDYEAQRHWMEITTGLPVAEWYEQGSLNDLQYWGLDYPPLTAYVSWMFGMIAKQIEPEMVALGSSHGYETESSKMFMRLTVVSCDLVVFFPALWFFISTADPSRSWSSKAGLYFLLLTAAPFVLIDHGHFQYNNVSLGLSLIAASLCVRDWDLTGSMVFTLAMGFKQITFYYALPFFFYLLGKALKRYTIQMKILQIIKLGTVVILTLVVLFLPWILNGSRSVRQVVHRMFPFDRGLFEDKAATFWCSTNILAKWRERSLTRDRLPVLAAFITLVASLPTCIDTFRRSTRESFFRALSASAFAFFLFYYQTHEKMILFPLLFELRKAREHPIRCTILGLVATISLLPLLRKDGLLLPTATLGISWTISCWPAHTRSEDWLCLALTVFGSLFALALEMGPPIHARYPDIGLYVLNGWCFLFFAAVWSDLNLKAFMGEKGDLVKLKYK